MAAKKQSSGFDFVLDRLKKKRNATYAEIKESADKKGIKIYPILYGRAQALLGIVKSAKRGKGKARAKKKAVRRGRPPKRAASRRGPGRPRKTASALDSLEGLITGLKEVQRDRDQLRTALEKIQGIIEGAL